MTVPDARDARPTTWKRRKKLILPGLQLRLTGTFALIALLALAMQTLLITRFLMVRGASDPEAYGAIVPDVLASIWTAFAVAGFVLVPVIMVTGVRLTHRIAGPVFRFERYLADVRDGKATEPCKIRKSDSLHQLCRAINEACAPLLDQARGAEEESSPAHKSEAA